MQEEKQNLIDLVMVHISGTSAERQQVRRVLSTKSEDELQQMAQRIRLKAQTEETRRAYVQLQIVRSGLANTDKNWKIIQQHLPGEGFTLESFRRLVESDPTFKQSLQWDAEPFAAALHAEQEQATQEQQRAATELHIFNAAARAVTGQGLANVATVHANFNIVKQTIEEDGLDFTMDNVIRVLLHGGLNLAQNDQEAANDLVGQSRSQLLANFESYLDRSPESFKIREWAKDPSVPIADVRERLQLVEQIADTMSPHQEDRAHHFRKLVLSVRPVEEFRQRVANIDERRDLRNMSRDELRQHIQRELEAKQQPQITLPPEITAEAIRKASAEQHRKWNKQYGHQLLDLRLQGVA